MGQGQGSQQVPGTLIAMTAASLFPSGPQIYSTHWRLWLMDSWQAPSPGLFRLGRARPRQWSFPDPWLLPTFTFFWVSALGPSASGPHPPPGNEGQCPSPQNWTVSMSGSWGIDTSELGLNCLCILIHSSIKPFFSAILFKIVMPNSFFGLYEALFISVFGDRGNGGIDFCCHFHCLAKCVHTFPASVPAAGNM